MFKKILFIVSFILFFVSTPLFVVAQSRVIHVNAADIATHAQIFITPQTGTFIEGSTFEVPVYINTEKNNINAIELHIQYDPHFLSIINPSGGKSIIGLWAEPPKYDNTQGTAKIVGIIPGGITTDSGLIVTVTFQAKLPGETSVSFSNESNVLLNDGGGSAVTLETGRATYSIVPKPPAGVAVYSETHPFQDHWYNNNNPVLNWPKDEGVTGFSYVLDSEPNTVPPNTLMATDTVFSQQNLPDGLWYFHIKAYKKGVWGNTTSYLLRIDTSPPAIFSPKVDFLSAAIIDRFLVSFFTTDALSGIDHYEVGVIDKTQSVTESPVFVETESPYQLPFNTSNKFRVIIRAFDKAGNTRDASIDVTAPAVPWKFLTDHLTIIIICILSLIILLILVNYLFVHKVLRRLGKAIMYFESTDELQEKKPENFVPQTPPQDEVQK